MSESAEGGSSTEGAEDRSAPKGISSHVWQKFQKLRKRRLENTAGDDEGDGDSTLSVKQSKKDDNNKPSEESSSVTTKNSKEWTEVKKFMGAHDHLKGIEHGRYAPKTELEQKINKAVALGKFDLAEELSDHLAKREFGKRIADAMDAKKFDKERREQEEEKNKHKKKIDWWDAPKQRWETKSNM